MGRLIRSLIKLAALAGTIALVVQLVRMYKGSPEGAGGEGFSFSGDEGDDPYAIDEGTLGGELRPELIERLVCPVDKGPLELVDGKWLVNRRNGYRYPITDGIPVMLVEVGERYRDPALITAPAAANGSPAGVI
jgi:uncharacterized protein YbaR (Trm112 family)